MSESIINDSPRGRPYIWVTWLTGLLAGTDKCQWKSWYKSHHKYRKTEGDGSNFLEEWTKQHDAMTEARVAQLKTEKNWTKIQVEDDNAFKLEGAAATLSGKPDIVAIDQSNKVALIVDEKSGKERESDVWQVMIYMFALPLTWLRDTKINGEVQYRASSRMVPAAMFTASAKDAIVRTLRMVGGSDEPPRSPSAGECRFCDIASCPDRYEAPENSTADGSRFF